ncbi:hypothetical protein FACS1894137_06440 [Spirochaetia bacterium]|nr:hypothetical protein FACS1894137_06440 [Spirochaetia bacterium]
MADLYLPANFILILHRTYRRQGFFNITVENDHYFGPDGNAINIFIDDIPNPIIGHINRTANTNGTARIMGNVALRNWFENWQEGQPITVTILDQNSIRLTIG